MSIQVIEKVLSINLLFIWRLNRKMDLNFLRNMFLNLITTILGYQQKITN